MATEAAVPSASVWAPGMVNAGVPLRTTRSSSTSRVGLRARDFDTGLPNRFQLIGALSFVATSGSLVAWHSGTGEPPIPTPVLPPPRQRLLTWYKRTRLPFWSAVAGHRFGSWVLESKAVSSHRTPKSGSRILHGPGHQ